VTKPVEQSPKRPWTGFGAGVEDRVRLTMGLDDAG
jgi:hypothetical protein